MEIQRQARFFIAALPIFGMRQDDQPPSSKLEGMLPQCPTLRPPLWGGVFAQLNSAKV